MSERKAWPFEVATCWAAFSRWNGEWKLLPWSVRLTRAEAIDAYDECLCDYARARRNDSAKVARVTVAALAATSPDRGDER